MNRPSRIALPAIALSLLAGCAHSPGTTITMLTADGTTILVASDSPDAVMEAGIDGVLQRSPGGCIGIELDGTMAAVQFPFGTTLSDDGTSISVPDGGLLQIGDTIRGGGGYIPNDDVPEPCRLADELIVWQTTEP